jgi:CheY-like chemotaxis protein
MFVNGDMLKMKQILGNIINNALKFTREGSIDISYQQQNGVFQFSVRDSGIGISEADMPKVFERFRQIETELGKSSGGTGLGLAICKSLVELMGGKIYVQSEVGRGSTFTVEVPLIVEAVDENMEAPIIEDTASKTINLTGKKILIAEDEAVNMLLIKSILEECNAIVFEAFNGLEVVDFVEKGLHFDLIIMDIKMPKLNGIEAAKKILEKNSKIPIIALTAYAMHQEIIAIRQAGMNDIVTKPVDTNDLFFVINKYLA